MLEGEPELKLRDMSSPPKEGDAPNAERLLAALDPNSIALVLSAAADITLIVSPDGTICDRVIAAPNLPPELFAGWSGKAFADTVTVESRTKIEQLLNDAAVGVAPRWRQINHPVHGGDDVPIRYIAMRAGHQGHIIALGRDMRTMAALQQRLLAAEQSIEQEYARLRHAETRYRLMLQVTSEAVVIVDARTARVVEANPAAASLLRKPLKRLTGSIFQEAFDGADVEKISGLMDSLRSSGRADDMALMLDGHHQQAIVSSSLFRQDSNTFYLFRLVPVTAGAEGIVIPRAQSKVVKIIQAMPDGFVVTDLERRILTANTAFLDITQMASEEQARGEPIDRWVGRPGIDTGLMISSIKENGSVRQFNTIVRGQFGTVEDVDISGVAVTDGQQPCYGFTIRRAVRRRAETEGGDRNLLRSVDEMTKLVGKVPLKELVRETTDIIERLCIEAALQLNGNNRANAADMLGLSRQSLYMKLHRYGIDETGVSVNS
jgi:transcriptional regulator PpsR